MFFFFLAFLFSQKKHFTKKIRNLICDETQKIKGLPPGRILYCKIPLVFRNGPTSNHRAGPILRLTQLQSEASWFTAILLFVRSRFVHNNLIQRLSSTGVKVELPVIGCNKPN